MNQGFKKLIEKQKAYYKSIVSVFCPILQETIYFTSEGFNHLLYESYQRPRKLSERYMKLKCLKYAKQVINKCKTISKTREAQRHIKGKLKKVVWYELICEVKKGMKIRVIVEKRNTGRVYFLSVMPHNSRSKPKKRPKGRF